MSDFKREERYVVLKRSDMQGCFTATDFEHLQYLLDKICTYRVERDAEPFKCVVVERDWPEYEPMWKAIEKRVESESARTTQGHGNRDHFTSGDNKMNAPEATAALQSITLPALAKDEIYAGIILKDGTPTHHLILLPGETKSATWKKAGEWAAKQGGELPTRKEQALLFANAAGAFEETWYWSGEQCSDEGYAWFQGFTYGTQLWDDPRLKLRARAVRRISI